MQLCLIALNPAKPTSTTEHVSVPWEGMLPARCSSACHMPVAVPWYLSSSASRVCEDAAPTTDAVRMVQGQDRGQQAHHWG
jgi:hypothetical protein